MKILRPYQHEALDISCQHYHDGNKRALVVMASGLGKSVFAAALVNKWFEGHTGRILFLVDTIDILKQVNGEFREALDPKYSTCIVSSHLEGDPCAEVVLSTFQTMQNMCVDLPKDEFSLIIVDEAHHGHAVTYRPTIEYFEPLFCIGMTATPDRMDGKDIREIFGEEIYSYPLSEAIVDDWLAEVDYRLMTDNLSIRELRKFIRRIAEGDRSVSRKQIDDTIFLQERLEVIVNIIRSAQQGGKKTIVFCRSIEHVGFVKLNFPEAEPYHSQLSPNVTDERFNEFKNGGLQTILVVDKFNEGIDIPDAELIVFLRATDSKTIWLQQLGRGLRRINGKKQVIVLDFVANCNRVLDVYELGLEVTRYGGGGDKPEFMYLEGTNFRIEFTEEIRDLLDMLKRLEIPPYETVEEAMAAVQRLSPVPCTGMAYKKTYKQDQRLPSNPYKIYQDFHGWYTFLGTAPYETWQEAAAAVQKLNPIPLTGKEYKEVYKQDPHLPADPHHTYKDFPGTMVFLGTIPYETWQEAAVAVQRLNPVPLTSKEYLIEYKQDKRLLSAPEKTYKNFPGWYSFLGKDKPIKKYQTWQEAAAAVQRLNPVPLTSKEYHDQYKQNLWLPSHPNSLYKDFPGWKVFLGTALYKTVKEAIIAVRELNPVPHTRQEYVKVHNQNPRLPSDPYNFYKDFPGWRVLLGTNLYETWQEAAEAVQRMDSVPIYEKEYRKVYKLNPRLPSDPYVFYKDFPGWRVFLRTNPYETWQEATEAVQKLNPIPCTQIEYRNGLYKQDLRLRCYPKQLYKDFPGWDIFLGKVKK